jgi:large subunit ribosomal protein L18
MASIIKNQKIRARKRLRIRGRLLAGNRKNLKRIFVDISNKHINVQLIDDLGGATICGASSKGKVISSVGRLPANKDTAKKVAERFFDALSAAKLDLGQSFLFDRGTRLYHGKVAVIADTLREKGVKI